MASTESRRKARDSRNPKRKRLAGEAGYRQKMDQVLVGVQVGGDLLELDQLIDVAVECLELLDVHLAVLHIV